MAIDRAGNEKARRQDQERPAAEAEALRLLEAKDDGILRGGVVESLGLRF